MSITQRRSLDSNAIKLIAILAMTVDHIAWAVFPGYPRAALPLLMAQSHMALSAPHGMKPVSRPMMSSLPAKRRRVRALRLHAPGSSVSVLRRPGRMPAMRRPMSSTSAPAVHARDAQDHVRHFCRRLS